MKTSLLVMKTSLLTLLLALMASFNCYAQTEKGAKMIGGSGAISLSNGISVYLRPNLGYFVTDDLALGSAVLLGYSKRKSQDISIQSTYVGLQPFVRYYFGEPAVTRVFVQANTSLTYTHRSGLENYPYYSQPDSFTDTSFGGGIGLVHFLTQQVGLEAQAGYRTNSYGLDTFSSGLSINFGLQIHLPSAASK